MITNTLTVAKETFEAGTGWQLKPEGACLGDICVPLGEATPSAGGGADGGVVDVAVLAEKMQLPLVHDEPSGLWALGPHSIGGRTLASAEAPALRLPDLDGNEFDLASLRGKKVLLWAWAPY